MKVWEVLGYRKVEYTNKEGRVVKGYDIHICVDSDNPNIVGMEVDHIFLPDRVGYEPMLHDRITLIYEPNYRGIARVVGVAYAD